MQINLKKMSELQYNIIALLKPLFMGRSVLGEPDYSLDITPPNYF